MKQALDPSLAPTSQPPLLDAAVPLQKTHTPTKSPVKPLHSVDSPKKLNLSWVPAGYVFNRLCFL
jgi:hypothetical protein